MMSLRDMVAHYSGFNEETQFCCNIVRVSKDEVIATDFESYDIPLFDTTWKISKYMPFLVLNLLSYFNDLRNYPLNNYNPEWINRTIKISEYLENKDNQPLKDNNITLAKNMHPSGFDIRTDNVLPLFIQKKSPIVKYYQN